MNIRPATGFHAAIRLGNSDVKTEHAVRQQVLETFQPLLQDALIFTRDKYNSSTSSDYVRNKLIAAQTIIMGSLQAVNGRSRYSD